MTSVLKSDDAFAQVMKLIVRAIHKETDEKIAALRSAMSEFAYKGMWTEGKHYKRGNFVTLGSVWHAACDTTSKPGSDSDWTLVIAKPRDGRDAPPPEPPAQRTVRTQR